MEELVTDLAILLFLCLSIRMECSDHLNSSSGFTMEVIPRDHPMSPLYPGNLSQVERNKRLHDFSEARAFYLLSIATHNTTKRYLDEVRFDLQLKFVYYVVKIEMGDPSTTLYLLVDTGSSLMWTQLKNPYTKYLQNMDLYDPLVSKTYLPIPTNHPTCSGPGSLFQNQNGKCRYLIKYGNDFRTFGHGSFEQIRVSPTRVLNNVIIGCSTSRPIGPLVSHKISGIIGLSKSSISIVSQFPNIIKGKYSYCFPPIENAQPGLFYLTFGDSIPIITQEHHVVKFVRSPKKPECFYLNLIGISVGGNRVKLPLDTFKLNNDGTGGLLIDSGTLIPRLDATTGRDAYHQVLSYFQDFYDARGLVRDFTNDNSDYELDYELCYKYKTNFRDYASMTYHFEGGHDYKVEKQFTNFFNDEQHYFCVNFIGGKGHSVLGAWHQQNMRLIFDVNDNKLLYTSELC